MSTPISLPVAYIAKCKACFDGGRLYFPPACLLRNLASSTAPLQSHVTYQNKSSVSVTSRYHHQYTSQEWPPSYPLPYFHGPAYALKWLALISTRHSFL
eukprot:IDg3184t1